VTVSVSCDFDKLCCQLNTQSQVRIFYITRYHIVPGTIIFLIRCKDPK